MVSLPVPKLSGNTLFPLLSSQRLFKKSRLHAEGENIGKKNAYLSSVIATSKYLPISPGVEKCKPLNAE